MTYSQILKWKKLKYTSDVNSTGQEANDCKKIQNTHEKRGKFLEYLQITGEIFNIDEHRILAHVKLVARHQQLDKYIVERLDLGMQLVNYHLK